MFGFGLENAQSLVGVAAILAICWAASENRGRFPWKLAVGVMAVQGDLKHKVHYVFENGHLAVHLESAYDAFRAHCKRIDYEGEMVDLKALRRLVTESKKQGGFVTAESERS